MSNINLSIENYNLAIAGKKLLSDTKLVVAENSKYALVGKNGVGKSTLMLDLLTKFKPEQCYYVSQEILDTQNTVFEHILSTNKKVWDMKNKIDQMENPDLDIDIDIDMDLLDELYQEWECNGYQRIESTLHRILHGLGFSLEQENLPVNSFSGGWRMRISLASALFIEPPLLLLDEPTNHLDINGVIWLMNYLSSWKKSLIVVSHDTEFVQQVCENIILLENYKLYYYKCRYLRFINTREKEVKTMQKKWDKYSKSLRDQKKKGKGKAVLAEWIKKNEVPRPPHIKPARIDLPELELNSKEWERVLELKSVTFGYGKEPLFQDLDFNVVLGDRITIVGSNGVGKSTLFKLLYGDIKVESGCGEVYRNQKLRVGYYHQHTGDILPDTESPMSYLHSKTNMKEEQVREYLGKIGVPGKSHVKPISTLSGGQKARVALLDTILSNPHVMLLDEPTNHLDTETIDILAEALADYKGAIVTITHSLNFMEKLDTQMYHLDCGQLTATDYESYCESVMGEES